MPRALLPWASPGRASPRDRASCIDECTITVFLQELLKFAFETPEHSRSLTHLPLSLCSPMAGFFLTPCPCHATLPMP